MGSLISVIIPTYNRAGLLTDALKSVIAQTDSNFEIIVVDDGSTDNTKEILSPYMNSIKYIFEDNKGPAAARNRGLLESRGDFIAYLDSDDMWEKNKLQKQRELFEKDCSLMLVHTDEIWIRKGIRVNQMKKHQKSGGDIFERSLELCLISPSAVMMRRELFDEIGLWDENLPFAEDYDLWLRILTKYPVGYISEPLVIKRGGHSDQQSRKFIGGDKFRIYAIIKLLRTDKLNQKQKDAAIEMLRKKCLIYGNGCIKHGRTEEGERFIKLSDNFDVIGLLEILE